MFSAEASIRRAPSPRRSSRPSFRWPSCRLRLHASVRGEHRVWSRSSAERTDKEQQDKDKDYPQRILCSRVERVLASPQQRAILPPQRNRQRHQRKQSKLQHQQRPDQVVLHHAAPHSVQLRPFDTLTMLY